MKKLLLFALAVGMLETPACAALNLYRAENGQLVIEATDCQSLERLANLAGLPDDPPDETDQEKEANNTQGNNEKTAELTPVQSGAQKVIQAIFGKDEDSPKKKRSFKGISENVNDLLTTDNFAEYQDALISYVRDVNWKTGLFITWRDYSIFRRLKMACSGINQLSKPFRTGIETYTGSLDDAIETTSSETVNKLAEKARNHSFSAMTKLSLVGWVDAIDKHNAFLILALDEKTYNELVEEYAPEIAVLFENMYTFFKIRSVLLDNEYNENTKALNNIAKLGKGDSFNTWHILSEYAKKILELNRNGKLTVEEEKTMHIWRLNSAMSYVHEHVRVEKRAATLAAKNPQNATLIKELKKTPKKKLSLDDKARELLQNSTQDEIKKLIKKYKGK